MSPTLVKKIEHRISQLGLKQASVAASMGVQPNRVYLWLKGKGDPSPAELLALSRILRTTVLYLADDEIPIEASNTGEPTAQQRAILMIADSIGFEEAMKRLTLAGHTISANHRD